MKKLLIFLGLAIALVSCAPLSDDIINPDAEYLYFYSKTCPHCTEVNAYMTDNNTHATYSIEKREITYNAENQRMFQVVTAGLGIEWGSVPFVVHKESWEYTVGTGPVIALFPPIEAPVWEETVNSDEAVVPEEVVEVDEVIQVEEAPVEAETVTQ